MGTVFASWPGRGSLLCLALLALSSGACAGRRIEPVKGATQRGIASWYGEPFHGRKTANGETYDMHGISAAHQHLPLGSVVRVTNLDNGRQIEVRINDRGPFVGGRILDLSYGAAQRLGMAKAGLAKIKLEVLSIDRSQLSRRYYGRQSWTVQAGAFRDLGNADDRQSQLEAAGYTVQRSTGPNGVIRLRVGEFNKKSHAQRVLVKLRQLGIEGVVVARR